MTFEELRDLISEGYKVPQAPIKRTRGVCIHHSYQPKLPEKGRNYAEIFHKFHYENNDWDNGLGYDFVVSNSQ